MVEVAMADTDVRNLASVTHGFIDDQAVPGTVRLVDISSGHDQQDVKTIDDIILVPNPSADRGILIRTRDLSSGFAILITAYRRSIELVSTPKIALALLYDHLCILQRLLQQCHLFSHCATVGGT